MALFEDLLKLTDEAIIELLKSNVAGKQLKLERMTTARNHIKNANDILNVEYPHPDCDTDFMETCSTDCSEFKNCKKLATQRTWLESKIVKPSMCKPATAEVDIEKCG